MPEETLIMGAGIVAFLCMYLLFKLAESSLKRSEIGIDDVNPHYGLQLILIGMVVFCIFVIGKASLDGADYCAYNVQNATEDGLTTSFSYVYECTQNTHNTPSSFYNIITWFVRIMGVYLTGFVFYAIGKYFYDYYKGKKGKLI